MKENNKKNKIKLSSESELIADKSILPAVKAPNCCDNCRNKCHNIEDKEKIEIDVDNVMNDFINIV